jgi:hypothetical protein
MDIKSLKSDAYDCLAQIEYLQKKLAEINQKIAEAMQNENNNSDSSN